MPATYCGECGARDVVRRSRIRSRAALPFDAERRGIVSGEGSAMLFLEREDHARARGAHIYGIVRGYGTVADGFHPSSPEPSGRWEQARHGARPRGG